MGPGMITRARQIQLALAAALIAAAVTSQAHETAARHPGGRPGPPAARGFTLVAAGDVLPDSSVLERAGSDAGGTGYDFRPMLAGVQPLVSRADLAICHMRTVHDTEGDPAGSYVFKTPPQVAGGSPPRGTTPVPPPPATRWTTAPTASGAPWTRWTGRACGTRDRPAESGRRAPSP